MPRTIAFFDGSTPATGAELWETDGTDAATGLAADIIPGPSNSFPGALSGFAATGTGGIVFAAYDGGTNGTEPFVSNGGPNGTGELSSGFVAVPDLTSHFGSIVRQTVRDFTPVGNGRVLFTGSTSPFSNGLWQTDGTVAGTSLLRDFGGSSIDLTFTIGLFGITALGNGPAVFGLAYGASAGLWGTDGTPANTLRLGPGSPLVALGDGRALTSAPDGSGGILLGVTNGTVGGTQTAHDFAVSISGATPIGGGRALLAAADGLAGTELWVSDGTTAGTSELVQGPAPGRNDYAGFFPRYITALGDGRFLFAANDGSTGAALWVTNGTAAGTALVEELAPPSGTQTFITGITAIAGGKAIVQVADNSTGVSTLLVSNGTAAGTAVLQTFAPASGTLPALGSVAALPNGKAVFSVADPGANGTNFQVWTTDGSVANTAQIADVPQTTPSGASGFTVLPDGRALFTVYAVGGSTLWATSGTASSTGPIAGVTRYGDFGIATVADRDPLFDSDYYYSHNPDVAAAGVNAYQHYFASGGMEGRSADPFFDSKFYLAQNPDVAASGINPLLHFETYGWHEGRDPSLLFSDAKYLAANPDVAGSGMDPLAHYLQYGQNEGRLTFLGGGVDPSDPLVNAGFYDRQLGAALIPTGDAGAQQAASSYDASGWRNGLNPDVLFDTKFYLANNPDVAAAQINPLTHYEQYGWKEGRDPSAAFSTNNYLAANPDVAAARLDPLLHYLVYGQTEGRAV